MCKNNFVIILNRKIKDFKFQDGATPLFKAAHKGHSAVVHELVKYKPNLGLLEVGRK